MSADRDRAVIEAVERAESLHALAVRLGVSPTTIRRIARRLGVRVAATAPSDAGRLGAAVSAEVRRLRTDTALHAEIVAALRDGQSLTRVAQRYNLRRSKVTRIRVAAGIPPMPRARQLDLMREARWPSKDDS